MGAKNSVALSSDGFWKSETSDVKHLLDAQFVLFLLLLNQAGQLTCVWMKVWAVIG